MRQDEVIDASAMTGHLVAVFLIDKLARKRVISSEDAADVLDSPLLALEQFQAAYPAHRAGFEKARRHLDDAVADLRRTPPPSGGRSRHPPLLRD
jgi:hypothetical protein